MDNSCNLDLRVPWPYELRCKFISQVENCNNNTAPISTKKKSCFAKEAPYISCWLKHYDHCEAYT